MHKATLILIPVTLALAGCGASGYASAGKPVSAPASVAAEHATIKTRHGSLGTFLVNGSGRTLYLFRKDTGRQSKCYGPCAAVWPPVTTSGKPQAAGSARQSMLSTSRRRNGTRQVLYNGHPLYRYAPDTRAGQTGGQGVNGFGARWYVVAPSGKAITSSSAPAPSPYSY
jgi:predicted lipoprotein with Yx(FWY)xxD motif